MNNLKKEFYKKFADNFTDAIDTPTFMIWDWIEKVIKEETDEAYQKGWLEGRKDLVQETFKEMKLEGNLVDRVSKEEPRHLQFNPYEDKSEFADWK